MSWTECVDDGCQIYLSEKNSQAGTHNSPGDRDNQAWPTTRIGERRWKQTQGKTGPPNNLVREGPPGPMEKSRAGSTVSTILLINSGGKRWKPETTPDKWQKKGPSQRTTEGNQGTDKAGGHGSEGRGAKQLFRTWMHWEGKSRTSEANSIAPPKSLWQKTMTRNGSTRKRKNSNRPTMESKRECARSGVSPRKQDYNIVGSMQWGEGS